MTGPAGGQPGQDGPLLDAAVLRRRVLLVAALSLALLLTAGWVVTALGVSDGWLLVVAVLLWVLVVRPLMRPVREALRLRRALAYQAWVESRREESP